MAKTARRKTPARSRNGRAAKPKTAEPATPRRVAELLHAHFRGRPLEQLSVVERKFPFHVRADLQAAVDDLFRGAGGDLVVRHFGGVRKEYSHEGLSFSGMLADDHSPARSVPPEYEEVDVGDAAPVRVLKTGLWLLERGGVRCALLLTQVVLYGEPSGVLLQIAADDGDDGRALAPELFGRVERAVAAAGSYRGKVLSLEQRRPYRGESAGIAVHRQRAVAREQVILPARTLELLERNVVRFVGQREGLRRLGLATKKGLLFYGPPGTGKTHTIHYLAGALPGHTTLLITAEQVGLLDEYMTLARLLQPSIVVIEDADLIARDRARMNSPCEEVLLNKLLNEMDGLRAEADVLFVLTTNRPEALEAALASRPGRIDQAIEFPLPDDGGRRKLVRLYSAGAGLSDETVEAVVRRTERVSAAFIKEIMRRSAQFRLERGGDGPVELSDVEAALEEMLFSGGSLNLALLGGPGAAAAAP